MGYFTCDVHEIFESKIHAELKQSRKQHNRPTSLSPPRFFFLFNTVASGENWREDETDKENIRISLAQMYAYRGLRGISEVCALLTEYMHELELDSLESKNTN